MPSGARGERKARIEEIVKATKKCGYCPLSKGCNKARHGKHGPAKRRDKK